MSDVRSHTDTVAGLPFTAYTLGELSSISGPVAILFFLHGRSGTAKQLEPSMEGILRRVAEKKAQGQSQATKLVIVTFDQRNHGHRLVDEVAVGAWKDGNQRHAIDMHAMFVGTARDVSYLIDFLPAYLFPSGQAEIVQWLVAGISLGGHAAWYLLRNEPRIILGIPIIGCPDYLHLIADRAKNYGIDFAPPAAPTTFVNVVKAHDPAHSPYTVSDSSNPFLGKKILVLSGKEDTLVPWASSDEFVKNLNVGDSGVKQVFVYPGVGHMCTEEMLAESADFVWEHSLKA